MDIGWDYAKHTCRLSMHSYINKVLAKYGHKPPSKPQLSHHAHALISYGAKTLQSLDPDSSPPLNEDGIKRVQGIVGALLWYGRAVDNKLLVVLSAIGSQQAAATEATAGAIDQLLDYVSTYPNNGITYRASAMVLAGHSDAGYLNKSCACSRAGTHIFLSEDEAMPKFNGLFLTIAEIIKFVMSSATKAELAVMFIVAKKMVPLHQMLIEMHWPQPPLTL